MTQQITVLSGKGGTGKTSITAVLAQLADEAILCDVDVDAANLHLILKPSTTLSEDFISGKIAIKDDSKCIDCGKCYEVCRFNAITPDFSIIERSCEGCGACAWVCPEKAITMKPQHAGMLYESTTRYGPMFHARLDIGGENSGKLVTAVIQRAHEKASELKKELVIVDGSPGIGCPVIAALTNATLVLLVVEPTTTAIHDMKRTIELATHFKLPVSIMVNKSTINEEQLEAIIRFANETPNVDIVGQISYDLRAYKAMTYAQTLLEADIPEFEKPLQELFSNLRKKLQELKAKT